jgi:hypothetical protein
VKVPTGPKNAKVRFDVGFEVLAGIKTRLEPTGGDWLRFLD